MGMREPPLDPPYDPYDDWRIEERAKELVWIMFSPDEEPDCVDAWLEKVYEDIDERHIMFISVLKEMLDEDGNWKDDSRCAYSITPNYRLWRERKAGKLVNGDIDIDEVLPTTLGVVKDYFEEVLVEPDDYYAAFHDLFWPSFCDYLATHQDSKYGESYEKFVYDFKGDKLWEQAIDDNEDYIRRMGG